MENYTFARLPSPLGPLTLAARGFSLCGLWLPGQKHFGGGLPLPAEISGGLSLPPFDAAGDWLDRYFSGRAPDPAELPLSPEGSPFRQLVWRLLLKIPRGEVVTYKQLAGQAAKELGRTTLSCQAVGGAVAHNPISVIIPCHRVVGSGGSLTGYAGGIAAKRKLLSLEGVDLSPFTDPKGGN